MTDDKGSLLWPALGVIGVTALIWASAQPGDPQPAKPKHDCSGAMKQQMEHNPVLAEQREALCDKGGEAAMMDLIKERENERRKPAF